jgi:hypothetical protein
MRSGQQLKNPLAVAFAIGAIAAPAAAAHSQQSGWVVRPNPDQQATELARLTAAPAGQSSTWIVRPNPDQQATELARLAAARAAQSPTWVVRPNPDEQIPTPGPATIVRVPNPSTGFDWGDAGIGAAGALGLAALAVAGGLAITQRRARRTTRMPSAIS